MPRPGPRRRSCCNNPAKSPAEVIFDQHALGAWLNFANGSVSLSTPVDTDKNGTLDSTFGAVMFDGRDDPDEPGVDLRADQGAEGHRRADRRAERELTDDHDAVGSRARPRRTADGVRERGTPRTDRGNRVDRSPRHPSAARPLPAPRFIGPADDGADVRHDGRADHDAPAQRPGSGRARGGGHGGAAHRASSTSPTAARASGRCGRWSRARPRSAAPGRHAVGRSRWSSRTEGTDAPRLPATLPTADRRACRSGGRGGSAAGSEGQSSP